MLQGLALLPYSSKVPGLNLEDRVLSALSCMLLQCLGQSRQQNVQMLRRFRTTFRTARTRTMLRFLKLQMTSVQFDTQNNKPAANCANQLAEVFTNVSNIFPEPSDHFIMLNTTTKRFLMRYIRARFPSTLNHNAAF